MNSEQIGELIRGIQNADLPGTVFVSWAETEYAHQWDLLGNTTVCINFTNKAIMSRIEAIAASFGIPEPVFAIVAEGWSYDEDVVPLYIGHLMFTSRRC